MGKINPAISQNAKLRIFSGRFGGGASPTCTIDVSGTGIDIANGDSFIVDMKFNFGDGFRSGGAYSAPIKVIQTGSVVSIIAEYNSGYSNIPAKVAIWV